MVGVSKIGTSNLITGVARFLLENIIVSGSPEIESLRALSIGNRLGGILSTRSIARFCTG